MITRPNFKSPLSRFDKELRPDLNGKTVQYWLYTWLPSDTVGRMVKDHLHQFRRENTSYFNDAPEYQIPAMCKASKTRASLLASFCQDLISLILNGYELVPLSINAQVIKSNYKVRFIKKILGTRKEDENSSREFVELEVLISNHPRHFRHLYDAIVIALINGWSRKHMLLLCVVIESLAYDFESVVLTDNEIIEAANEFLRSAAKEDPFQPGNRLEGILSTIEENISSRDPKIFFRDIKDVRKHNFGFIKHHTWDIDDAAYSTASSGSQWVYEGSSIPNIGILFNVLETDFVSPIDDLIGYKSYYPTENPTGFKQYKAISREVPKTSSRGVRIITSSSGPIQDRGNYFEKCEKVALSNMMKCDSTFNDDLTFLWIQERLRDPSVTIICTDIKAATDEISHQFLLRVWGLLFPKDVPEFLLYLHSQDGTFNLPYLDEEGNLKYRNVEYYQRSGVRCGVRSNFSVALALPHHLVVRSALLATIPNIEWEDPSKFYRLKGDDVVFSIPNKYVTDFISNYRELAKLAGFNVHPIEEKGFISRYSDPWHHAEWCKQVWIRGHIVSRIPHRLFFSKCSFEKELSVLLWLSQYDYLEISYKDLIPIFKEYMPNIYHWQMAAKFFNFLIDYRKFGIPKSFRFELIYGFDEGFLMAQCLFYSVITTGIWQSLFNPRQRLKEARINERVNKFTSFFEDQELLNTILDFASSHGSTYNKLTETLDRNRSIAEDLKTVFCDDPYVWYAANLGIFSEQEKDLIRRCISFLNISSCDDVPYFATEELLEACDLIKRIQPHSVGKRISVTSSCLVSTIGLLTAYFRD